MTIAEIYQESDTFFEFPTPNHSHVTTTSAILFAQHIAKQAHREGWEQCKMECIQECADAADDNLTAGMVKHAIASMEYKGAENDQTR